MSCYKLVRLNTARNALRYVIKAFKIDILYIPYYICPVIRVAVSKEKCVLKFYHIDKNFVPLYRFPKNAFILYPNYFGICSNIIDYLVNTYPNMIIDNAHSFFSEPKGIASFNSLRKFFPKLYDGALLYTKKSTDFDLKQDKFFYEYNNLTYENLCKNENRLNYEDIKYMSNCTLNYFSLINLEDEKEKYINTFYKNHKKYGSNNRLKIDTKNIISPYKYPYLLNSEIEADKFVNKLEKKGKVIFRYWHNMPESYIEKEFYLKLVAI